MIARMQHLALHSIQNIRCSILQMALREAWGMHADSFRLAALSLQELHQALRMCIELRTAQHSRRPAICITGLQLRPGWICSHKSCNVHSRNLFGTFCSTYEMQGVK